LDGSTALLEFWVSSTKFAVAWVTRDGFGIIPKDLDSGGFQRISSFVQNVSAETGSSWQEDSRALGQLLLSGIEPLGRSGIRHLVLVPDGILQSIPFEALRAGTATGPLLVERFDISYLPSAAALLREPSAVNRWPHFPWQRQLLALGDPIVRSQTAAPTAGPLTADESRARLPKSAEEVEAIARISRGRADVYLGAADLKRHLLEGKAKGASLLHLSTHATADDDNPERSRILFSPAEPDQPADYLFLKEIYGLDLRGVDLTTLSACDTERGKLIKGEGIQGFSRALLSAGSGATVTSLWRVADQPTAELMKQFYYGLSHGIPKAEALRLAKLKFLHSDTALQHPRHWAAFILHGDGLQPVPTVISWGTLLIPLAAAIFVFGVAARRRC
jgi:CHAT domain-containing protein